LNSEITPEKDIQGLSGQEIGILYFFAKSGMTEELTGKE
jgi:hypothetical protein